MKSFITSSRNGMDANAKMELETSLGSALTLKRQTKHMLPFSTSRVCIRRTFTSRSMTIGSSSLEICDEKRIIRATSTDGWFERGGGDNFQERLPYHLEPT
jgi:hypothetical protein